MKKRSEIDVDQVKLEVQHETDALLDEGRIANQDLPLVIADYCMGACPLDAAAYLVRVNEAQLMNRREYFRGIIESERKKRKDEKQKNVELRRSRSSFLRKYLRYETRDVTRSDPHTGATKVTVEKHQPGRLNQTVNCCVAHWRNVHGKFFDKSLERLWYHGVLGVMYPAHCDHLKLDLAKRHDQALERAVKNNKNIVEAFDHVN